MPNINSLKKIEFNTLPQFLEDLNSNLAVIENSPLFKGIPGDEGQDGGPGIRGDRGSRFLFVNLSSFIDVFGAEVQNGSSIDGPFINSKLVNFTQKANLLQAFGITEIVDRDVIVLTNSAMWFYNNDTNEIIDTGQAFNPENNLVSNIEETIERIVQQAIENNEALNSLSNLFNSYRTLAKNYADDNSAIITDTVTPTSVYSPYINGYTGNIGIEINNHSYFGYTDEKFPLGHQGTMVYGSIKRYYQMLMATIAVDGQQSLTSDYAPGANNIPALVLMQDTYNNGLYFGYKGKSNLKSFGSIYKNDQNELVLKSDSSKKLNEYSQLLIHKDYLRYSKQAYFGDNVQISKNLELLGALSNELLRTSAFAGGTNDVQIGKTNGTGKTTLQSGTVNLQQYLGHVLVTSPTGDILKTYRIESASVPTVVDLNLYNLSSIPSSANNILTSNYFRLLAARFNSISEYVQNNYWKKSEWNSGVIPNLSLTGNLSVGGNTDLGLLTVNKTTSTVTVSATNTVLNSSSIRLSQFVRKVLVTDANGSIVQTHEIESSAVNHVQNPTTGGWTGLNDLTTVSNVLTSKYYNILLQLIRANSVFMTDNYWRKNQFNTGVIPDLKVSSMLTGSSLTITGALTVTPTAVSILKPLTIFDTITLQGFSNKVLVTNPSGTVLNQYVLFNGSSTYTLTSQTNPINNVAWNNLSFAIDNVASGTTEANNIIKYPVVKNIVSGMNQFVSWCLGNFWRKDQYNTGEIPALTTSNELITNGVFHAGTVSTNRNLSVNGASTIVGRTNGTADLRGTVRLLNYTNADFIGTNNDGSINVSKTVSADFPKVAAIVGGVLPLVQGVSNTNYDFTYQMIKDDYYNTNNPSVWDNGNGTTTPGIYNEPVTSNATLKILTIQHFRYLWYHIRNINDVIKSMYSKTEIDNKFQKALPIGTILAWDKSVTGSPALLTDGWYLCDGRTINLPGGGTVNTPDLVFKFLEGVNAESYVNGLDVHPPSTNGANPETNYVAIRNSDLPTTTFTGTTSSDGHHNHSHQDTYANESPTITPANSSLMAGTVITSVQNNAGNNAVWGQNAPWDYDNNRRYYVNRNTSSFGLHSHTVSIRLNTFGLQTTINKKPASYRVFYIVKLHN